MRDHTTDVDELISKGLPGALRLTMLTASNGEVAWPIGSAADAVEWIAAKDFAILGGEAWLVGRVEELEGLPHWGHDGRGRTIFGFVPVIGSSIPAVRGWATDPQPDEAWDHFVARCRSRAIAALQREQKAIGTEIPVNVAGQLYYNLSFDWEPQRGER